MKTITLKIGDQLKIDGTNMVVIAMKEGRVRLGYTGIDHKQISYQSINFQEPMEGQCVFK